MHVPPIGGVHLAADGGADERDDHPAHHTRDERQLPGAQQRARPSLSEQQGTDLALIPQSGFYFLGGFFTGPSFLGTFLSLGSFRSPGVFSAGKVLSAVGIFLTRNVSSAYSFSFYADP